MTDLPTPDGNHEVPKENLYRPTMVVNPLDGLPEWVKHPKNYEKIQKALLNTLTCGKSHSDLSHHFHCPKCTENMRERRNLMHKFGFKSPAQYMAWRRTHEEIKKHMPLDKYNKLVNEDKTTLEK